MILQQQTPGQLGDVDFDQYAGYVTVDSNAEKALFYYFVESSEDPWSKPLILWLSGGKAIEFIWTTFNNTNEHHFCKNLKNICISLKITGPGCSSIGAGAFLELGPFRVNSDGRTLFRNEYAWNNGMMNYPNSVYIIATFT